MFIKNHSCFSVILLLLGGTYIQTTIAATPQQDSPSFLKTIPIVITISGGPAWANVGKTQTLYIQSDIENTYAASKKTKILGTGEVFLGLWHTLGEYFDGQLGIALSASSKVKPSGQIWEDADAEYNNFNYSYSIKHSRVGLKGKLITHKNPVISFIQPYISGSVGIGFNRAYYYQTTAIIPEAVEMPGFSDNSTKALSYTLGAGIQTSFYRHWQIGLGYEFANWGKNHLGCAPDQTINSRLQLKHFYTNELQFSLSFIA